MQQYLILHHITVLHKDILFKINDTTVLFKELRISLYILDAWGWFRLAVLGFIVVDEVIAICIIFGVSEAISNVIYSLWHINMEWFFGLQEILHIFSKSDQLIHLLLWYIHYPWRLVNATKYILDIKFSSQMYMCIFGRCQHNGIIFFATFWANRYFPTHSTNYLKH
jgi:hypothetical protein